MDNEASAFAPVTAAETAADIRRIDNQLNRPAPTGAQVVAKMDAEKRASARDGAPSGAQVVALIDGQRRNTWAGR